MKFLIVEDDFTSRVIMQKILNSYGMAHIAANGKEAVQAISDALKNSDMYDAVFLDIMMPEMDGHEVLKSIREQEDAANINPGKGVKVIMTTALSDGENIFTSFREQCEGYLIKPISKNDVDKILKKLNIKIRRPRKTTKKAKTRS
jgi:two-component system chemotaxis response regulator CheY